MPLTIGVGGLNSRIARQKSEIIKVMREAIAEYERKLALAAAAPDGEPAEPEVIAV